METRSKRFSYIITFCVLVLLLFLTSCSKSSDNTTELSFTANVVSLNEDTLLVRPDHGTAEEKVCNQIYVPVDTQIMNKNGDTLDLQGLAKASQVKIVYDGVLDGSDPAQIKHCYKIIVLK